MTERELKKVADVFGADLAQFITDWWYRHPQIDAQDMVCIVAASYVVMQREFVKWLTEAQNGNSKQ